MNTCVRLERLPCQVRTNITNAGTYTSASNTTTVDRINVLLPSVSIPRDLPNANHEGSIHEPLLQYITVVLRDNNTGNGTHMTPQTHEIYAVNGG